MLSSEYSKGILVIMLTRGLSRPAVILSKLTAALTIMTVCFWMSFGVTYGYTVYFWSDSDLPHVLFAGFALWVEGIMYISITMLGCVLFRQMFTSVLFLLAVTVSITLLGMLKSLERFSPMILSNKNVDLLSGAASLSDFAVPMAVTLVISAACILGAAGMLNKKQV